MCNEYSAETERNEFRHHQGAGNKLQNKATTDARTQHPLRYADNLSLLSNAAAGSTIIPEHDISPQWMTPQLLSVIPAAFWSEGGAYTYATSKQSGEQMQDQLHQEGTTSPLRIISTSTSPRGNQSLDDESPSSTENKSGSPVTIGGRAKLRGRRGGRPRAYSSDRVSQNKDSPQRRHSVQHNYHDFSYVPPPPGPDYTDSYVLQAFLANKKGGGCTTGSPFPMTLHHMLERANADGYQQIVSWQPHGRAFLVHNHAQFMSIVMPRYFRQTRFSSFQRQLSLYGFLRLSRKGPDSGAYYHELFLRGKPFLCVHLHRTRVKGSKVRKSSSPETEPDFYAMPPPGNPPQQSLKLELSSSLGNDAAKAIHPPHADDASSKESTLKYHEGFSSVYGDFPVLHQGRTLSPVTQGVISSPSPQQTRPHVPVMKDEQPKDGPITASETYLLSTPSTFAAPLLSESQSHQIAEFGANLVTHPEEYVQEDPAALLAEQQELAAFLSNIGLSRSNSEDDITAFESS